MKPYRPSQPLLITALALMFGIHAITVGAQNFSNHVYQAVSGTFTWHAAKADAEARGGHLATITSQGEFDYLLSLGVLPTSYYWLGATDEAVPGVWVWVTGEPWSFTAWAPGEPNELGIEDYLHSLGSANNHYWNNWERIGSLPFYLLEIEPPVPSDWVRWTVENGGNGHWYLPVYVTTPISWDDALASAQTKGGQLATVTSAQENAFVFALINYPQYWNGEHGPLLGGYQPPESPEPNSLWTWVTGETWGYSNWAAGQPDNGGEEEDGLHFWNGSQWNDKSRNARLFLGYVVERNTPPLPAVIAGPVTNHANGHFYYLLGQSTWVEAEAKAIELGGHLATVRNQSEQDWISTTFSQFGGTNRNLIIGLYDSNPGHNATNRLQREAEFVWASGEPGAFTYWAPGEPNNYRNLGEFWVHMVNPAESGQANRWNDVWNTNANYGGPLNGVVEVNPTFRSEMTIRVADVEVCWTSRADMRYVVQYRSELTTNMWADLSVTPIQGTGTNNCIIDPIPRDNPQRFYRVLNVP